MASMPACLSCSPEAFQGSEPVTLPIVAFIGVSVEGLEGRVARDGHLCLAFDVLAVAADEGGVVLCVGHFGIGCGLEKLCLGRLVWGCRVLIAILWQGSEI